MPVHLAATELSNIFRPSSSRCSGQRPGKFGRGCRVPAPGVITFDMRPVGVRLASRRRKPRDVGRAGMGGGDGGESALAGCLPEEHPAAMTNDEAEQSARPNPSVHGSLSLA